MTHFKTQIELFKDKCVHNITIALFDFEKFNNMTQEQVDEYLAPDRMHKHKILQKCLKEIEENRENLALLIKMKEKYGDKEPTDDITGPVREALDRATREYSESKDTGDNESREDVSERTSDDGGRDGSDEDKADQGGHRDTGHASEGAGEDDRKGDGAGEGPHKITVTNETPDTVEFTVNRTGVEK